MKKSTLFIFCVLTSATLLASQVEKKKAETPEIPLTNAKVRTFENGATVIIEEDHSAPVASVQAWCNTGSIDEGDRMGAGLSHILEHMLFKGTEKRSVGEIALQIQNQGGYINAYTSYDRTVFWIDVPSSGAADAAAILADAMMNSTLPKDEYDREQEVIRREFAMGFDDPARMSQLLSFSTVFRESPYRHPVIGYLDVYNKLTREDVMKYYKERYVPNNLTFVIVGDVDADKIFSQLEEFFSNYPRKALKPVYIPDEPQQLGRREMHKEFPTDLTRLDIAWKIPGISHPDTPALDLLARVLGGGRSTPLYREIRENKGIAYQISCEAYTPAKAGVFSVDAITDPQNRKNVENVVLEIIQRIKDKPVTAEELAKAKKAMLSEQLEEWTTVRGKASDLGSNWLLTGNLNFSRDYLAAINKVTPEDLKRVARAYLTEENISVTSLNPIGSLAQKQSAEKEKAAGDIQQFELSNGLRLLVREDSRIPKVSMVAVFRGGVLAETPADNGVTALMANTLLKGTSTRSAAQIAEQIESVGGSIASTSGSNTFSVAVETMKTDTRLGMDILADVLQNPTFPDAEVNREKQAQLAAIKEEDDKITSVAQNYLRQKLFANHAYALRTNGSAESVATLTGKDLKTFHDQFAVAKNGVIAVFGDVKAAEVKEMAEKTLAKMKSGNLGLQNVPAPQPLLAPVELTKNRNKQQAVVMFGFQTADIRSKDLPALQLIEDASSDLGSRFFVRIREKQALAYFVGAKQLVGIAPGAMIFYLGADPKKAVKATAEFSDEIRKLANDGLGEDELLRAKKKFLGAEAIRNQSNSAFAQAAAVNELLGLGYDYYKKETDLINAVTVDKAREVAKKYLGAPGFVEVIVEPPQKGQTDPNKK
ncbi:MAG: pitrilysin family protein [Chthoniobacterales bacterium]